MSTHMIIQHTCYKLDVGLFSVFVAQKYLWSRQLLHLDHCADVSKVSPQNFRLSCLRSSRISVSFFSFCSRSSKTSQSTLESLSPACFAPGEDWRGFLTLLIRSSILPAEELGSSPPFQVSITERKEQRMEKRAKRSAACFRKQSAKYQKSSDSNTIVVTVLVSRD